MNVSDCNASCNISTMRNGGRYGFDGIRSWTFMPSLFHVNEAWVTQGVAAESRSPNLEGCGSAVSPGRTPG